MNHLMLVIGGLFLAFEFQNLLSWWRGRVLAPALASSDDFTLVVPLYGDRRYFAAGRRALAPYRENTLVSIDLGAPDMAEFAQELEAEGFQVCRSRFDLPNPATLVSAALDVVKTTAVLRLDADTLIGEDLREHVASFLASDADLASVKVHVSNRQRLVCRFQHLEYQIAMLGRHFRPWLTSGACVMARTASLRVVYAHHSHWSPGEDIETGRAALALRMKLRHCDMVVHTLVPDTWRGLLRQRRLWWAGSFRHTFINLDRNLLHMPVMTCYWMLFVWSSVVFKWWSYLDPSQLLRMLPVLYLSCVITTGLPNLKVAHPLMLVFPLYALVQSLMVPVLGALTYCRLAYTRGRLGRYRFGYRRRRVLVPAPG